MTTLEEQIRGYAEGVVMVPAIGPDPAEESTTEVGGRPDGSSPSRWGQFALAACLAVLVGLVAVVALARGDEGGLPRTGQTDDPSGPPPGDDGTFVPPIVIHPLTATATVQDGDLALGTTVSVHVELTNVIDQPVTVQGDYRVVNLAMDGPQGKDAEAVADLWSLYATSYGSPYATVDFDPSLTGDAVVIQPGQTASLDLAVLVGDETATGTGTISVKPMIVPPAGEPELPAGSDPEARAVYALEDVLAELPISVAPPSDGRLTQGDAIRRILGDPRIQAWSLARQSSPSSRSDDPRPGGGVTSSRLEGDQWRFTTGAVPVSYGADVEAAVRAFGGPGFIAAVTADGPVEIVWMAPEPPGG